MRHPWLIDRRTCLRGLGVALALPLLETMGWAETPRAGGGKPPVRLGFMYNGCGVNTKEFWPADPKTYPAVLPPSFEPLRAVIDQCLVLGGLNNVGHTPLNGAAHALELSTWLTATIPNPTTRDIINIAVSADQVAAEQLGIYTAIPSLEVGPFRNEASGLNQENLTSRYWSTGNFRTPTQPLPVENNPTEVFKRLFASRQSKPKKKGGPAVDSAKFAAGADAASSDEESLDRSMLDLVQAGAGDLRKRISINDQRQLDDYLDSVRSLEKRVAAIERQQAETARSTVGQGKERAVPLLEVKIPPGQLKWSDHVKVMGDLLVLAFQADITRVGTLISTPSHMGTYPELDVDHHHNSHHENNPAKLAILAKIDRFNLEQFAYVVARMKSIREGGGTLLDNCMFMWGSGLGDGNGHTNTNLPCIVAGRGGGTIRTGRYVQRCNGVHADLLTALLARAGVNLAKPIGNGTKLLPDLA